MCKQQATDMTVEIIKTLNSEGNNKGEKKEQTTGGS